MDGDQRTAEGSQAVGSLSKGRAQDVLPHPSRHRRPPASAPDASQHCQREGRAQDLLLPVVLTPPVTAGPLPSHLMAASTASAKGVLRICCSSSSSSSSAPKDDLATAAASLLIEALFMDPPFIDICVSVLAADLL